jgi:hypothetical protein
MKTTTKWALTAGVVALVIWNASEHARKKKEAEEFLKSIDAAFPPTPVDVAKAVGHYVR